MKKVNSKVSGKPPEKSPHWVSLAELCRGWVTGEELRTGSKGLLTKFSAALKNRLKMSSYESACWGALRDCKMLDAARNLQVMVLDQKLPLRGAQEGREIYLGFVDGPAEATHSASVAAKNTDDAIAAHKQRVIAACARTQAEAAKASPARAAKRTAPKRRPTRG